MRKSSKVALVAASCTAAIGIAGGTSYAVSNTLDPIDSTGVILGCYDGNNGKLRVSEPGQVCGNSEKPIVWNQQGVEGDKGDRGDTGEQGSPVRRDLKGCGAFPGRRASEEPPARWGRKAPRVRKA